MIKPEIRIPTRARSKENINLILKITSYILVITDTG